jgi:hypothetical protein
MNEIVGTFRSFSQNVIVSSVTPSIRETAICESFKSIRRFRKWSEIKTSSVGYLDGLGIGLLHSTSQNANTGMPLRIF